MLRCGLCLVLPGRHRSVNQGRKPEARSARSCGSDWYSPQNKPDERFKINVFILSHALRSDSLAVTVDRQVRTATGQWTATTIARKVEDDLETAILLRAGQLKRAWLKEWKSG